MRYLLLLLILLAATAARAADKPADSADVRQGHWRVQVSAARGVALWYDGVPVSRQSTFYIVKPGWTGLLYDQRAARLDQDPRPVHAQRAGPVGKGLGLGLAAEAPLGQDPGAAREDEVVPQALEKQLRRVVDHPEVQAAQAEDGVDWLGDVRWLVHL